MSADGRTSPDDVFINCPFDAEYRHIFEAIVFGVYACGFRPRSALEIEDGGQARLEKINSIIEQCRFGVHDLSRTELDPEHRLPRFNMPLELGIFLGAKRFGEAAQRAKRCLILDVEKHRYQKFISDLAGMDISAHEGDPSIAIEQLRNWLANVSRRKIAGPQKIVGAFARFNADLPTIIGELGFERDRIPYVDFEGIVTTWLLEA